MKLLIHYSFIRLFIHFVSFSDIVSFVKALQEAESKSENKEEDMALD